VTRPAPASGRMTTLLTNAEVGRAAQLRIGGDRRFTSRSRGETRARSAGRSIEFKDYKDYVAGDDIRYLDWNIFARLHRPYVRIFHDEEDVTVSLVVDASLSMKFEDKLLRAQQVATVVGIAALLGGDRLVPWVVGDVPRRLRIPRGRAGLAPLFRELEAVEPAGRMPLEAALREAVLRHHGRGYTVVVSDFLTGGDLASVLNLAHGRGQEVFALQILGPGEIDPALHDDLRLVDIETDVALDVTAGGDLLEVYRDHREALQQRLFRDCRQRGGRFVAVSAGESVEGICFERLRQEGWLL